MNVVLPIRIAAILLWIGAVGLGVPSVLAIRNLLSGRGIPLVLGYPAYGGGPFERIGIQSTVPLIAGFLLLCILDGVAGWLLWGGHRTGAALALVGLPFAAIYWWGFALPYPPMAALLRTVLILLNWRSLS